MIFGAMSRKLLVVRPPESVTVRWIRNHTVGAFSNPDAGAVNVPDFRPGVGVRNGWM